MDDQATQDKSAAHAHQYDATALPLGLRVLASGINTYLRAIKFFSRHVVENAAPVQALQRAGKPVIILIWHERTFQVPSVVTICPRPLYALTSRSRDGAVIGNVMRAFGMRNIQGSGTGASANKKTNPRKRGAQAYRAMLQVLRRGETVIATGDVPPGPARVAGPGMIHLALRSGAPIIVLGISRSKQYRLRKSWDQLRVPVPFGKLAMVFGDPIEIDRDTSEARLAELQMEISDRLNDAQKRAEQITGEKSD